jgi:hypothetical protein
MIKKTIKKILFIYYTVFLTLSPSPAYAQDEGKPL